MFKAPVSTIRDVAELTDASPNLIARLLGEMRGTSEFENLVSTVDGYGQRISKIEQRLEAPTQIGYVEADEPPENAIANWIVRVGTKTADFLARVGLRINVLSLMATILVLALVVLLGFWSWIGNGH
jgi:hypothetical protein